MTGKNRREISESVSSLQTKTARQLNRGVTLQTGVKTTVVGDGTGENDIHVRVKRRSRRRRRRKKRKRRKRRRSARQAKKEYNIARLRYLKDYKKYKILRKSRKYKSRESRKYQREYKELKKKCIPISNRIKRSTQSQDNDMKEKKDNKGKSTQVKPERQSVEQLRKSIDITKVHREKEKLRQKVNKQKIATEGDRLKIRILELRAELNKARQNCKPKLRVKRYSYVMQGIIRHFDWLRAKVEKKHKKIKKKLSEMDPFKWKRKVKRLKKECVIVYKDVYKAFHRFRRADPTSSPIPTQKATPTRNIEVEQKELLGKFKKLLKKARNEETKKQTGHTEKVEKTVTPTQKATPTPNDEVEKKELLQKFKKLKKIRIKESRKEADHAEKALNEEAENKRLATIVKGLEKWVNDTKANCPKRKSRVKRDIYDAHIIRVKRDETPSNTNRLVEGKLGKFDTDENDIHRRVKRRSRRGRRENWGLAKASKSWYYRELTRCSRRFGVPACLPGECKGNKKDKQEYEKWKRICIPIMRKRRSMKQKDTIYEREEEKKDNKKNITQIKPELQSVEQLRKSIDEMKVHREKENLVQKMIKQKIVTEGDQLKIRILELREEFNKVRQNCEPKLRVKKRVVRFPNADRITDDDRKNKRGTRYWKTKAARMRDHKMDLFKRRKKPRKLCKKWKKMREKLKKECVIVYKDFLRVRRADPTASPTQKVTPAPTPTQSDEVEKKELLEKFKELKKTREEESKIQAEKGLNEEAENKRLATIVKGLEKWVNDAKTNCPKRKSRVKKNIYDFHAIKMKRDEPARQEKTRMAEQKRADEPKKKGTEPKKKGTEVKKKGTEPKKNGTELKKKETEPKKKGTEVKKKGTEPKKKGTGPKKLGIEAKPSVKPTTKPKHLGRMPKM